MPYFFFYFSNSHVYKCHSWLQYTVNRLIQELNLSKFFSCEQTEVLANCSTAPFNREHSEKLSAGDAPYHRKRSSSEQHCWRQGQLFTWSSSQPAGLLKTSSLSHHFRRITKSGEICMSHRKETFHIFAVLGIKPKASYILHH